MIWSWELPPIDLLSAELGKPSYWHQANKQASSLMSPRSQRKKKVNNTRRFFPSSKFSDTDQLSSLNPMLSRQGLEVGHCRAQHSGSSIGLPVAQEVTCESTTPPIVTPDRSVAPVATRHPHKGC